MRETISTTLAPSAIGPYSQAIKTSSGGLVFISGQIPLDPDSMEIVGDDVSTQTKQVLKNLGEVLKAAGSSFQKVAKCTIFLKSLEDFNVVNKIYGQTFVDNPPARACVEVSRLPKDVLVEIDAIAEV